MKKKTISVLIITIGGAIIISFFSFFIWSLIVLLTPKEDTTSIAKEEFLQYFNGTKEVALFYETDPMTIFYDDLTIKLDDLLEDSNEMVRGGIIADGESIIFASSKCDYSSKTYSLILYKYNVDIEKSESIFIKSGYNTNPQVYGNGSVFYIEHYEKHHMMENGRIIDEYNVLTGIYKTIATGKNCSMNDYKVKETSKYIIETIENESSSRHGEFLITDNETGKQKIINDDFLANTIYYDSMGMFNYGPERAEISKGHILLVYSIGAGNGRNYSHLVFEYNYELNTLEYKLLAFTPELLHIRFLFL